MGTKETCDKTLKLLYERAKRYADEHDEVKLISRQVELVNVLKSLGIFCFYSAEYEAPAFIYRGHEYKFDMAAANQLSLYTEIAEFDEDDYDVKCELYDYINVGNWTQFMMSLYICEEAVVLSSSQYVGKRMIDPEEVVFMLKSMDENLRDLHKGIGEHEYLYDKVVCV